MSPTGAPYNVSLDNSMSTGEPMTVDSFRAELQSDIDALRQALKARQINCVLQVWPEGEFQDLPVEMQSDASLQTLREVMNQMPDGQVMSETLRACPLADNTLEREADA
jgi:hypothetical protein